MPCLQCAVCGNTFGEPLYASGGGKSLTSLCRVHPAETLVFACVKCGHLQTAPLDDVAGYYATEYDILVDSEEEDQIYEVRAGTPVYRTEHQVEVLLSKLPAQGGSLALLDYGCAKSATIRALRASRPDVTPHAFDISDRYIPFWEKFIEPGNWAVDRLPRAWQARFDVVTSFFSLEHIPDVSATMEEIAGLLKPGGMFYCVVPNVFGNTADFIVVDHCNHFTAPSLRLLVERAGLSLREIDADSHRGAFVLVADKPRERLQEDHFPDAAEVRSALEASDSIAAYWRDIASRIRDFEAGLDADEPVAIYGAGFYGALVSASLANPARVACHIDQNRFLSGRQIDGCPIVHPEDVPSHVRIVLVGLNPAHARSIISGVPALASRGLQYFYL